MGGRRWHAALLLAAPLLLLAQQRTAAARSDDAADPAAWAACSSEQQIIECGQIPFTAQEDRVACCALNKPLPPGAADEIITAAAATVAQPARSDLTGGLASGPNYKFGTCMQQATAAVPAFRDVWTPPTLTYQAAPQLGKGAIQRIKAAALAALSDGVKADIGHMRSVNANSGFVHPGTTAGPAELALMRERLRAGSQTHQVARDSLLWGHGVRPKLRPAPDGGTWAPPTDTPADGYYGPLAMQRIKTKWSGLNVDAHDCPGNYPWKAPKASCGHISLVELDAQMALKQALAWHATGDERYANTALRIIDAWASTNKEFGLQRENGPLEAAWACGGMTRALELLRTKAYPGLIAKYINWVNHVLMPDMDWYVDVQSRAGIPHFYGNWQASIGECMMAMGILSDDRARYAKAISVFHSTVNDYFKWGRGSWAHGRILGECSETLRDQYHVQFGLGGLLQMAEMAWQQDDDLFSANGYVLVAAMELHARINLAGKNKDPAKLPYGFTFFDRMPPPPGGSSWQFDIKAQKWKAIAKDGHVVQELNDGAKYVLGTGFLPTGWELGFNHYVGRLGLKLPETAKLLSEHWPEWLEFSWGVGTLTHADSARALWRAGVVDSALCGSGNKKRRVTSNKQRRRPNRRKARRGELDAGDQALADGELVPAAPDVQQQQQQQELAASEVAAAALMPAGAETVPVDDAVSNAAAAEPGGSTADAGAGA